MMQGGKDDIFYDARLVAEARLHLSTVMNGQYSEPFFVVMCKILSRKTFLGYKTLTGKDVKLSGILDFFYNTNYGLGIKTNSINQFLGNCTRVAIQDKTQSQYAGKMISWLKNEDDRFDFPEEYFQYKRLRTCIRYMSSNHKMRKYEAVKLLDMLYNSYPHLLKDVGAGRKFKDVFECCDHYLLRNKVETLKPIKHLKYATVEGCEVIAEKLYKRFQKHQIRAMIAKLIELYKADQQTSDSETAEQL
jgi:hypothetical protein